jgi:hypothetical protein
MTADRILLDRDTNKPRGSLSDVLAQVNADVIRTWADDLKMVRH